MAFTRVLGLVFGVSSYAFTMVLAVFLFGLGLGALAAQRIARRRTPTAADFGACQIAMAAVAMLAIPTAPRLLMYARQVPELAETTAQLRRGQRRFDEALGAFDAAGGLDGRLGEVAAPGRRQVSGARAVALWSGRRVRPASGAA